MTKPDSGTYAVSLLSGRNYQVTITKDGKQITSEQFEVPMITRDSASITRNFYVSYVDSAAMKQDVNAFANIYFTTDLYDLRPESITQLDRIAAIMKANPTMNLSIEGHCDSRNSDAYNMKLGKNRSVSAYKYLTSKGISGKRLVTISYGERRPVAANDSEENMQLNRRDEFKPVLKPGQTLKDLNLTPGSGTTGGTPGMDPANR